MENPINSLHHNVQHNVLSGNAPEHESLQHRLWKDEAVEEYLEQLCDQLTALPNERQVELRRELRQHLQMLMAECHHVETLSAGAALGYLVKEFGDPTTIGRELASQWESSKPQLAMRPPQGGMSFLTFSSSILFSCFLMNEMCWQFGWTDTILGYALFGPFLPLLFGIRWGAENITRPGSRGGYLLIALLSLALTTFASLPDFITHVDLPPLSSADLSILARAGHMLMWMWIACSACGLTHIVSRWNGYFRSRMNLVT